MNVTDKLQNAPLERVPQQEIEVIFLFSQIFKKFGFTKIKQMQSQFPDCVAYRKTNSGLKEVRIEFEYQSINFDHDPKKCDCIVCWEHNWYDIPKNLEVIELREQYGYSRKIWVMAVGIDKDRIDQKKEISKTDGDRWTVPPKSHTKDLVLFYHKSPDSCIKDIFEIKGKLLKDKAGGWTDRDTDTFAYIKRVARIPSPLFYEEIKNDRLLSTSIMIRRNMQGRIDVTENWHRLYDLIIKKNPSLKRELSKFSPEKIYI